MTNNATIKNIGKKYPPLAQFWQSFKSPRRRADWSDYESAKAVVNRYVLEPREYEACIRFIANRLRL
jgi:hypothetical protein